MNTKDFIKLNFNNSIGIKRCSSVMSNNGAIFSYGYHYPLLFRVNGLNFRNTAGYSSTTLRHISWTRDIEAVDVKLDSEAVRVINSGASDIDKLRAIKRCLNIELEEYKKQMESKKIKTTKIYAGLNQQFNRIFNNLRYLGV